jgi:hypothetical protein
MIPTLIYVNLFSLDLWGWGVGSGEWGMGSGEWGVGSGEWKIKYKFEI